MSDTYCVRRCFEQPAENHGHPGSISRVILGPGASNPERPEAIDSERLIIHTNEYEVAGDSVFLPRDVFHKHKQVGDTPLKFLFISAMV